MGIELIPGKMFVSTRSGEYVVISGAVQTSVSGNLIGLMSGTQVGLSGLFVQGSLSASISGQPVALVSGTQLGLSGLFIQGALTASVSGQTVALVSGTQVGLSGLQVITSISGQAVFISGTVALLSGGYVNIGSGVGVITSISGQAVFISGTVALVSGGYVNIGSGVGVQINPAYLSGMYNNFTASSPVYIASGAVIITSISGQAVFISGTVNLLSGAYVNIGSGVGIQLNPAYISGQYLNFTASSPIYVASGMLVRLESGENVVINSGANIVTSISGQAVFISGTVALLSGGYVNIGSGVGVITSISGQAVFISGSVTLVSGVVSLSVPSIIRARLSMKVTDLSGGATLASGGVVAVSLRSLDGDLWVGGSTGIEYPYSGYGMLMQQGDSLSFDVQNFNQISVVATVSGYRVAYVGQQ